LDDAVACAFWIDEATSPTPARLIETAATILPPTNTFPAALMLPSIKISPVKFV